MGLSPNSEVGDLHNKDTRLSISPGLQVMFDKHCTLLNTFLKGMLQSKMIKKSQFTFVMLTLMDDISCSLPLGRLESFSSLDGGCDSRETRVDSVEPCLLGSDA